MEKRINFKIPNGINLEKMLREAHVEEKFLKPKALDQFYYVLDYIYIKTKIFKNGPLFYCPINEEVLRSVLNKKNTQKIKEILCKIGVLEQNPKKYSPRHYSKSFRFAKPFRKVGYQTKEIYSNILDEKIKLFKEERAQIARTRGAAHDLIFNSVRKLSFDEGAYREYILSGAITNVNKISARNITADFFINRDYFETCDARGRIYHCVSSCPADLRQFLSYQGQELWSIDVKNSQPLLLLDLYPKDCPERADYAAVVEAGQFYEAFAPFIKGSDPIKKRKHLKRAIFRQIFFGKVSKKYSEVRAAFGKRFPVLYSIINKIKEKEHNRLALALQKIESKIILQGVAAEFAAKYPTQEKCLISVHDSLVSTKDNISELTEMMKKHFKIVLGVDVPLEVGKFS